MIEFYFYISLLISVFAGTFMLFQLLSLFQPGRFSGRHWGALGAGYIILVFSGILLLISINGLISSVLAYVYEINNWSQYVILFNSIPYILLAFFGLSKLFEIINDKIQTHN